jgi:hypothetical protein
MVQSPLQIHSFELDVFQFNKYIAMKWPTCQLNKIKYRETNLPYIYGGLIWLNTRWRCIPRLILLQGNIKPSN